MSQKAHRVTRPRLAPRVIFSLVIVLAWLIFSLIHKAFYASTFFYLGVAILVPVWISWLFKFGKTLNQKSSD